MGNDVLFTMLKWDIDNHDSIFFDSFYPLDSPKFEKISNTFTHVDFYTKSPRFEHLLKSVLNKCFALLEKRHMINVNDA